MHAYWYFSIHLYRQHPTSLKETTRNRYGLIVIPYVVFEIQFRIAISTLFFQCISHATILVEIPTFLLCLYPFYLYIFGSNCVKSSSNRSKWGIVRPFFDVNTSIFVLQIMHIEKCFAIPTFTAYWIMATIVMTINYGGKIHKKKSVLWNCKPIWIKLCTLF